jgi:hypothetical protein
LDRRKSLHFLTSYFSCAIRFLFFDKDIFKDFPGGNSYEEAKNKKIGFNTASFSHTYNLDARIPDQGGRSSQEAAVWNFISRGTEQRSS